MNTPTDPLSGLYAQLNRDHDAMRDHLLSKLQSTNPHKCNQKSRHSLEAGNREVYRRLAGIGAGAAVSVVLIVTTWVVFYWSPSLTLAQVKSAVAEQNWMKLDYEDGEEYWISLQDGRRFRKLASGRIFFQAPGIWAQYFPGRFSENTFSHYAESDAESGGHGPGRIEDSRATAEEMSEIPKWNPVSAWDYVVGLGDKTPWRAPNPHVHTEQHRESVDGRRLVRFDTIYVDALGKERLRSQVWADPATHLPVRTRKSKSFVGATGNSDDFVVGVFSFPETGPDDIYALGAPRDATIVKVSRRKDRFTDSDFSAEVRKLLNRAQEAADQFPSRLRIVKWAANEAIDNTGVQLVYWSGRPVRKVANGRSHRDGSRIRIRVQYYFNVPNPRLYPNQDLNNEQRQYYLPLPADLQTVLAWTATQDPGALSVYDGSRSYSLSGTWAALGERMQPTLNVMRIPTHEPLPLDLDWPVTMNWLYIHNYGWGRHELVRDATAPESDVTILRVTREGSHRQRTDYHISRQHGYICIRQVSWFPKDDGWYIVNETQLSDLRQLPNGSWWAAKSRERSFDRDGNANYDRTFLFDISPINEGEFPADAFDGGKLLETAERLNASVVAH